MWYQGMPEEEWDHQWSFDFDGPEEEEWMDTLKIKWEHFDHLKETVDLKCNRRYPIPDPEERLKLTLQYLATGEGFKKSQEEMMIDTMKEIVSSLAEHSRVRIS